MRQFRISVFYSYMRNHAQENILKPKLILKVSLQLPDRNPHLFHGIPIPYRNGLILLGVEIVCDAERRANLILPPVTLPDSPPVVKLAVIILGKLLINLLCCRA